MNSFSKFAKSLLSYEVTFTGSSEWDMDILTQPTMERFYSTVGETEAQRGEETFLVQ